MYRFDPQFVEPYGPEVPGRFCEVDIYLGIFKVILNWILSETKNVHQKYNANVMHVCMCTKKLNRSIITWGLNTWCHSNSVSFKSHSIIVTFKFCAVCVALCALEPRSTDSLGTQHQNLNVTLIEWHQVFTPYVYIFFETDTETTTSSWFFSDQEQ